MKTEDSTKDIFRKIMKSIDERGQDLEPSLTLALKIVATELGVGKISCSIEHPADESHGDYATNFALAAIGEPALKEAYGNPRRLAEEVIKKMKGRFQLDEKFEEPTIAGAGFINFRIKDEWLLAEMGKALEKKESYGSGAWGKGKRVVVDYSAPNIAKRFGVGHLRSTIVGQAICNLYKESGFEVTGDNHLGDWGTQFGMIIAAVEEKNLDVGQMSVGDLEDIYVEFNRRVEETPEYKDKAREAFVRLENGEEKAREIWQQAVSVSMVEFEGIYGQLGVKIDKAYGESFYEKRMAEVIAEAKEKGIAKESQGALIVEFSDPSASSGQAMPPAMLVKSNGTTTYFTRDLATVKFRLSGEDPEMKANLYIYEVGSEQTLHFQQVFETVKKLGWGEDVKFKHVAHGRLSLPEGKMSTRKGNTIKLEELLEQARRRAYALEIGEQSEEKGINEDFKMGEDSLEYGNKLTDVSEIVGMGAVKYNELKRTPATNYIFRWSEALNMQGDSGPYLQYTYARGKSVLRKAGESEKGNEFLKGGIGNEEERAVLRWLYRYPEEVEAGAREFAPNILTSYLFELARRYNTFYNQHKIVGGENEEFRLKLTEAVITVIKNGLRVLGIETVERM